MRFILFLKMEIPVRCGVLSYLILHGRGMDFFWNRTFLVANLATNFQDLVSKVENLVALAPLLGAISRPAFTYIIIDQLSNGTD